MLNAYSYKKMFPQKYLKLNDHTGQGLNSKIQLVISESFSLNPLQSQLFFLFLKSRRNFSYDAKAKGVDH